MKPYTASYTDADGKKTRRGQRNGIISTELYEVSPAFEEKLRLQRGEVEKDNTSDSVSIFLALKDSEEKLKKIKTEVDLTDEAKEIINNRLVGLVTKISKEKKKFSKEE